MEKLSQLVVLIAVGLGVSAACGESSKSDGGGTASRAGEGGALPSGAGAGGTTGGDDGSGASGGAAGAGGSAEAGAGSSGESGGSGASAGTGASAGAENGAGNGGAGGTSAGTSGAAGSSGSLGVGGSPPDGCTRRTERIGFASRRLFVALDRSTSLLEEAVPNDVTIWEEVTSSLAAMLQEPASSGLGVALRFFPHDQPTPGCSDPVCDFDACRDMLVPMGELTSASAPSDAHESALLAALEASAPQMGEKGGTPLYPALFGALDAAAQYQTDVPEERATVLLVTDGAANGCSDDGDEILHIASEMLERGGVATYVIGLPGLRNDRLLELIAEVGGSGEPVYAPDGASMTPDLPSAFSWMRDASQVCDFELPLPNAGSLLSYETALLQVRTYNVEQGPIARVASAAECAAGGGFTLDTTNLRPHVELCPASCAAARAPGAVLEVLLDECPRDPAP